MLRTATVYLSETVGQSACVGCSEENGNEGGDVARALVCNAHALPRHTSLVFRCELSLSWPSLDQMNRRGAMPSATRHPPRDGDGVGDGDGNAH